MPTARGGLGVLATGMSHEGCRVLLVSPVGEIRATYAERLRRHGLIVETAEDVTEGFERAVAHPPVVVVVDDATPAASEYLTRLRDEAKTSNISRLALVSSVAAARDLERAAAVLLKPAPPEDVYGKVLRLVLNAQRTRNP